MKKLITYIYIVLLFTKCAQITPLTGGKKDETPPKIIEATPPNASTNFNGKSIELVFDEYITLKEITNQFIITPQLKQTPDIQAVGKKVKITFKESLLPNTTYKLFFGNAIADMKELNVFSGFEYVFSTGNTIDSLKINGQVLSSLNNKPVENVLVGLYESNNTDSIVFKEKPLYISKTTIEGNFEFNYLPNSSFKMFGIKDENKNLMYDGSTEEIGFNATTVNANDNSKITLYLFKEIPSKQFIKKTITPEYGKAIIIYNKPLENVKTILFKGDGGSYFINKAQDSVTVYYNNLYDTLNVIVDKTINDTVLIKIPSQKQFENLKNNNRLKYTFKSNLNTTFPYFETIKLELNLPFDFEKIKTQNIYFYETNDSVKIKQEFKLETNEKSLNSYFIKTNLKQETQYSITFNKGLFTDELGRINDSITYKFKTTTKDDYGKLSLKLTLPHKENYMILLLNDKEDVIQQKYIELSLTSSVTQLIDFLNLNAGNYFIKVIEDVNKNRHFDTGSFLLNKQPETIYFNSTPIKLLSGWEIENEWRVN